MTQTEFYLNTMKQVIDYGFLGGNYEASYDDITALTQFLEEEIKEAKQYIFDHDLEPGSVISINPEKNAAAFRAYIHDKRTRQTFRNGKAVICKDLTTKIYTLKKDSIIGPIKNPNSISAKVLAERKQMLKDNIIAELPDGDFKLLVDYAFPANTSPSAIVSQVNGYQTNGRYVLNI